MEGQVSARLGFVFPGGKADFAHARELYGLALTVLPPALVLALAQPLLLQSEPSGPEMCMVLPSRIPTWWQRWFRGFSSGGETQDEPGIDEDRDGEQKARHDVRRRR